MILPLYMQYASVELNETKKQMFRHSRMEIIPYNNEN